MNRAGGPGLIMNNEWVRTKWRVRSCFHSGSPTGCGAIHCSLLILFAMPWNKDNYPVSMKNLTEPVRNKAVEIANALLDQGYEEGRAIAIATAQAEEWAANRDITIREEKAS
jgi:uncharacterized protein YoaH (UPF0181 family)